MWGWIPKSACARASRNEILDEIYYFLVDTYGEEQVSFWLDFNPKQYNDVLVYLQDKLVVGAK